MKEQNEQLSKTLKNKLEIQSKKEQVTQANNLIFKFNSFLHSWGDLLEKIICSIDSSGKVEECSNKESNWVIKSEDGTPKAQLEEQTQTGTSQGQQAFQKLKEVRQEFLSKQKEISEKLIKSLKIGAGIELLEEQLRLTEVLLETNAELTRKLNENLQKKIEAKALETQKTIVELNKKYSSLRSFYRQWEELKEKIILFKHYTGKVHNSICKNSQHINNQNDCLHSFEIYSDNKK